MVQVRNVPDDVAVRLKARAAAARMSLSDYLVLRLTELADRPTLDDVLEPLSSRPTRDLEATAVELLDEVRNE